MILQLIVGVLKCLCCNRIMQPLDDIWQLRIKHVPESTDFIASQCMLAPLSVYLICGTSEGERPERRQRMARSRDILLEPGHVYQAMH